MKGRCMRCKAPREMKGMTRVTMKNGRKAARGKCSKCGAAMFKIGG